MEIADACRLGYRSASSGFFFDSMELVAAQSTLLPGGIDAMRGPVELLFRERDAVNAHMAWVAQVLSGAFRTSWPSPTGVDDYRVLLRSGVFEIVNRWSAIADIKTVTRLQAWFYCGFGLGRAETVYKALPFWARMVEVSGGEGPVEQLPDNVRRMAAEAAKQLEVASDEDDFRQPRPLLRAEAEALKAVAIALEAPDLALASGSDEALARLAVVVGKVVPA